MFLARLAAASISVILTVDYLVFPKTRLLYLAELRLQLLISRWRLQSCSLTHLLQILYPINGNSPIDIVT